MIEDILTMICFIVPTTACPRKCLTCQPSVSYRLRQDSRLDQCVFDKLATIVHQFSTTFRIVCEFVHLHTSCCHHLLDCFAASLARMLSSGLLLLLSQQSQWTIRDATIIHQPVTTFRIVGKFALWHRAYSG